ncbi:MAG: fused MFS/spermidine synthase [Candidatus Bathyarchaeota archaeon]|nr:MAG: fused MFS/spermidine synthase [Candidatus Bathyarchaeota archaeon]
MKRLDLTFVVMGFSCSVSQVLLAREFMNIFSGNELILGVLFVNWLLCIALGSWGLGKLADRSERRLDWLIATLILVSIILPLQILFARSMGGWLVEERGEMAGLFSTVYATFLVLLPFCSLHGLQFTLGCRLYSRDNGGDPTAQISRVYILEALGSVLGGLAFSYILVHYLQIFDVSLGLSLLYLSLAFLLFVTGRAGNVPSPSRRLPAGIIFLVILVVGFAMLAGGSETLDSVSSGWQWEGLGLIHTQNSIYGNIAITQSDEQLDFWVNGLPLFTTPNPDQEFVEEIVHFPMLQHPSSERVLLRGGGLGGVLEELVKHPIMSVTYVELDPLLIRLARRYSQEASEILDDPRVDVVHSDGRHFVKGAEESFDVVIVNLPPPSTLQLNRFYTIEFFEEIQRILDGEGILSLCLPSSLAHMSEEMASRNKCVYDTIRNVFPSSLVVPGDYNIFLASSTGGEGALTSDADLLYQRLLDRGLETSLFTREHLRYKLSPERMEIALAYLETDSVEVNSDVRPVAVYHDLSLWNAIFHPQTRMFFAILSNVDLRWIVISLGLMTLALVMVRRKLGPRTPVHLAVFTTGLSGMTLSIIMLYSYQALCGYLYQDLGVVAAAFMLGLAFGGWFMGRRVSMLDGDVSIMFKTELAVILYSLLIPLAIRLLSYYTAESVILPLARGMLPLLNGAAGFFVGLEFPLASRICLRRGGHPGGVAGALYASDLLGACVGAFLSSVWLIPLHGVLGACLVAAVLNVTSFVLLYGKVRLG